jgi:hypothetical protein
MSFYKKSPKNSPAHFCQYQSMTFSVEKVARKFGMLRLLKKYAQKTIAQGVSENSPNLVNYSVTKMQEENSIAPAASSHTEIHS